MLKLLTSMVAPYRMGFLNWDRGHKFYYCYYLEVGWIVLVLDKLHHQLSYKAVRVNAI